MAKYMPPSAGATALAILALLVTPAKAQQQGDWIFDVFVQKCKESGGTPATTLQQYRSGQKFQCGKAGTSGASTQPAACEREAKVDVDWVFSDGGARTSYGTARQRGRTAFEAVLAAQSHNRTVQDKLRRCRGWVESYLASRGENGTAPGAGPRLGDRRLSAIDCRCISVVPNGTGFRITSSCAPLKVAVLFVEGYMAHGVHPVATSWTQAGIVGGGREGIAYAPPYKVPSIKAINLANDSNRWTCQF